MSDDSVSSVDSASNVDSASVDKLVEVMGSVKVADMSHEPEHQPKKQQTTAVAKKRLRHSNYFITVNTNKSFIDRSVPECQEVIDVLAKRLNEFITSSVIGSMILFKDLSHSWTKDFIKSVDPIAPVVERGKQRFCIHAHFKLCIHHWSCIMIDLAKLKAFFQSALPNCYVNVRRYTSDKDVEEYIEKDLHGTQPEVSGQIIDHING